MKKAWIALAVLLLCLIQMPLRVKAMERSEKEADYLDHWLGELDFTDLDELLSEEIFPAQEEKLTFSQLVEELLAAGIMKFDYGRLAEWAGDALFYEFRTNREILVEVVFLAIAFSVLRSFSGIFRLGGVSETCFLMVYSILAVLLLRSLVLYSEIAAETLERSVDFMKALVPAFCVSMVFSAETVASAGFYQMAFLVIYLIQWLFLKILMPLIHIYIIAVLFNHFFEDEKFGNLTELLKGAVNWGMKSAGVIVLGLNVVQGLVAPAKDRLISGTVSRATSVIPGVGNAISGVGELMLGAGILIKSCVGATALIFLLLIAMFPVVKIMGMAVLYKLAAVVVEPVSDKRITGCIRGMAEGGVLYLKLVLYGTALFFVTIALATAVSGGI